MDDRNTNKPGLEGDNQLPLDFEEAARVMSGNNVYENGTAQTPPPPENTFEEAGHAGTAEPAPAFAPAFSATPAPYPPPPPVQAPSASYSTMERKPSKTFADELSKSKAPLDISFGPSLREMRESRGISLNEVAEKTKIRKDYLDALEEEDFKRLPPAVFVCGYVRKICELYEVPHEVNDDIIRQLKGHADYGLGEYSIEQLIESDTETNPDAEQRIRRILLVAGAVLLVLVSIIVVIVTLSLSGREKAPPKPGPGAPTVIQAYNPESLKELNPPQVIKMSELPLPEN